MKLSTHNAYECVNLFDQLDKFATFYFNLDVDQLLMEHEHKIDVLRLVIRKTWYEDPSFIDEFIKAARSLSYYDKYIITQWKQRIHDKFFLIKHTNEHSILFSSNDKTFYGALGLTDSIETVLSRAPSSLFVQTTLLPYRDIIIWDGLSVVADNNDIEPVTYKRLLEAQGFFKDSYNDDPNIVITQLLAPHQQKQHS